MTRTELKSMVYDAISQELAKYNFVRHKSKERFIKQSPQTTFMFLLTCLDEGRGIRIKPEVAVRIEVVEQLFHRISQFDSKFQKDTGTVGATIRELEGASIDFDYQFAVSSPSDVPSIVPQL